MRWSGAIAVGLLAFLLAGAAAEPAEAVRGRPTADYWLLTEFDWGDAPETVQDSVNVAPGWLCMRYEDRCRFVKVVVDDEELLARFHYVSKKLQRITILTPDLNRKQAEDHLERVWRILSGYVERFKGAADVARSFPGLDALGETPMPTHYWMRPDMQIRLELVRNGEMYSVSAHFYEPYQP